MDNTGKRVPILGVDDMLDKNDIANHLGIGRDMVNSLFKLRGFPVMYIGRKPLVMKSKYQEWLNKNAGKFLNIQ